MKKIKISVYKSNFAMFTKGQYTTVNIQKGQYTTVNILKSIKYTNYTMLCPSTKGNLNNHFLGKWNK